MRLFRPAVVVSTAVCVAQLGQAIDLDLGSDDSIKKAAHTVAKDMLSMYTGNRPGDVPGNLPQPYYWWMAGAMFGALIDYWYYTGDTQFNDITTQALQFQVGPKNDFMPPNQTKTEGNDDQAFWGLAALQAAEHKFPDPPADKPQWLALAQAVFNSQALRWDTETCNGGLKWQIFTFNKGYNYKNTISNGCFFNLAARLGRYTGNQTYFDWAEKEWNWVTRIGLLSPSYQFFDGSDDTLNCTQLNRIQWTYNAGIFLYGAASIWNATQSDVWRQRTQSILDATSVFYAQDTPNVMYEVACEPNGKCNVDQRSFKGYLARWMAATSRVAPWTHDQIMAKLQASAKAAALQCSGGSSGTMCGLRWTLGASYDGSIGVGEQMAALEVIQSNLVNRVAGPVTSKSGGTSKGDPNAGTDSGGIGGKSNTVVLITTADRVGAGILTTIVLAIILGGGFLMVK